MDPPARTGTAIDPIGCGRAHSTPAPPHVRRRHRLATESQSRRAGGPPFIRPAPSPAAVSRAAGLKLLPSSAPPGFRACDDEQWRSRLRSAIGAAPAQQRCERPRRRATGCWLLHQQAVGFARHEPWNSGDARRHNRQSARHRLEQNPRNPFTWQCRQHEQVVSGVRRQQLLERNRAAERDPPFDAQAP